MPIPTLTETMNAHRNDQTLKDNGGLHLLDNPIWNSLRTGHASFAMGNEQARRFPAAIGPLSGIADESPESYAPLRELAGPGGIVVLFYPRPFSVPEGWTLVRGGLLSQMVCESPAAPAPFSLEPGAELRPLTSEDVTAMVALAELTEPGPFRERTIELGKFWGIFHAGQLVAMSGQRLHLPQAVEVSAVCTHPDARGRGYARLLIAKVVEDITQRGKTAFLHSFADNHSAIRVYESLGFKLRRHLHLGVLKNEL
ncbi:MAG TPA: GNAT family N-acetyltransferase [Terracidiphilus sp.]|jgi:GNAT superfamily N-acetyltransferase